MVCLLCKILLPSSSTVLGLLLHASFLTNYSILNIQNRFQTFSSSFKYVANIRPFCHLLLVRVYIWWRNLKARISTYSSNHLSQEVSGQCSMDLSSFTGNKEQILKQEMEPKPITTWKKPTKLVFWVIFIK